MRAVLLTGDSPEHRYVARRLAVSSNGICAIVVASPPALSRQERLARARRRFGLAGTMARVTTGGALALSGEAGRRRSEVLAVLSDDDMPPEVPCHVTPGVNSSETRALLQELGVDLLCVYGTAVVKDDTLDLARQVAINMHTGISPRYRGADCAFWPLHNEEPEWVGATVHVCTSALDGGAIYATAQATLTARDGIGAAFARAVVAGAQIFSDVVDDIAGGAAVAAPQDLSHGHEYRAAMRTWRAEMRTVRAVRKGLIRDYVEARSSGRENAS